MRPVSQTPTEVPDYADPTQTIEHPSYLWTHPVSEIVGALLAAGLRIERLDEHPVTVYPQFSYLERRADGYWHQPDEGNPHGPVLPLLMLLTVAEPSRTVPSTRWIGDRNLARKLSVRIRQSAFT